MLPSRHQPFIDHLGGIVPARLDVHAFLDNGVGARSQGFARLVLAWLDLRSLLRVG